MSTIAGAVMDRGYTSQSQHERLQKIARGSEQGLTQGQMAARMGLTGPQLSSFLGYVLGNYCWPPKDNLLEKALALEVLSDMAVRGRAQRRKAKPSGADRRKPDERGAAPLVFRDEALRARRDEATRQRTEREQYWLDLEQRKYALPRRGLPLSEQPA